MGDAERQSVYSAAAADWVKRSCEKIVVPERDLVVPENIDLVTILKTQQTNQLKANYCWIKILLFVLVEIVVRNN